MGMVSIGIDPYPFIKPTHLLVGAGAQGYLGSASLGPQQAAQGIPFLARWSAAQLQQQAEQKHILSYGKGWEKSMGKGWENDGKRLENDGKGWENDGKRLGK